MTKQYHAIPVLMYVPVDIYPDSSDAYDMILTLMNAENKEFTVFFAEDYFDGKVELDPMETEFSGSISKDCHLV